MTQRQKMLKALDENVIPLLYAKGFTGKFPDYKRNFENRSELLVFDTNKYGGSFSIGISTVFANCKKELSNYFTQEFETYEDVTVYSTNIRFKLKGMFDGEFYYTDLYKSRETLMMFRKYDLYESVGEYKVNNFMPRSNQVLVQKVDDKLYLKIAEEINRQMEDAYKWWEKYNTPEKMNKCRIKE